MVWILAFFSPILFVFLVALLGFITPGYDHFFHTISQLVIRKYGFIQQINFLQLSGSFLIASYLFSKHVSAKRARRALVNMNLLCAFFLLMVVLFPTDPRDPGVTHEITTSGMIHFSVLIAFFLAAPFGIYALEKSLQSDRKLYRYSLPTIITGIILSISAYFWTYVYLNHIWVQYLGIAQKVMVFSAIAWYLQLLWAIQPKGTSPKN